MNLGIKLSGESQIFCINNPPTKKVVLDYKIKNNFEEGMVYNIKTNGGVILSNKSLINLQQPMRVV